MKKTPEIIFDEQSRNYFFMLPPEICDILLIDYEGEEGVRLCNSEKFRLENFLRSLLEMSIAAETLRDQGMRKARRRVSRAILVLLLVVSAIFLKEQFLDVFSSMKWPLYIGIPVLGVLSCVVIFVNYIDPSQSSATLSNTLGFLEIKQRIHNEFTCQATA